MTEITTAAIVQFEAVHETTVNSVYQALAANGIEPTVFLNSRILEREDLFARYTDYGDRVHYRHLAGRQENWNALADEVRAFDLLVLNTFQRNGQALWARRLGIPVLGVVHNPRLFLRQSQCVEMVREGGVGLLTLAPHVTSFLMSQDAQLYANTATLAFWFWDMPEPAVPTQRRRIVIPGRVNFAGRDYLGLVDQLPEVFTELSDAKVEFAIVGAGNDRAALQRMLTDAGLEDLFWFAPIDTETGFVRSEVFYNELARASFLLPLLPENHHAYRGWKVSSAVPTSVGFSVPAILDRWTAVVYDVPCVSYPIGHMLDGLRTAIRMTDEELSRLRDDLAGFRAQTIRRSAEEMRFALDAINHTFHTSQPLSTTTSKGTNVTIARDDKSAFLNFVAEVLPASYSQRFQDLFALWASGFLLHGYFVEFGALGGKDFSNTYLLEQLGWTGVVAEPHPAYTSLLTKHRTCTVSTKCVLDSTGDIVTFKAVKGRPALSTIYGFGEEDSRSHLRSDYVAHEVETITLNDLIDESNGPQEIDYLSIDTEGSELRILNAFDFDRHHVKLISVEHNDVQRDALHSLLTAKGYARIWDDLSGHDDWYVLEGAYPTWSIEGREAATQAVTQVEPFEHRYEFRRELLVSHLEPGTTEALVKPKEVMRAPNAQYAFMRNFFGALTQSTELDTKIVTRRVRNLFQDVCRQLNPTLAFEIGAFEATYSKWMKANTDARVVAYEANPYVYEKFKTQVESAGVEYLNVAVGEKSGKLKLHLPKDFRGRERPLTSQMGRLRSNLYSEEHDVVEVDAVRLDDIFLDTASERIVAWIDVEGACEQVLDGSHAVLRHALAIYIEVERTPIWDRQWVDTDVAHFFYELGFTLVIRDQMRSNQFNLVFIRNEIAKEPWVAKRVARVYRSVRPRRTGNRTSALGLIARVKSKLGF